MVSRRKILSRSRDDLNIDQAYMDEEEDIWYQKDKLFKVSKTLKIFKKIISRLPEKWLIKKFSRKTCPVDFMSH